MSGVFSIRPLRGKAAASQESRAQHPDELPQCVTELSERVTAMEKANGEVRSQLMAMISVLKHQVTELKGKAPEP